MFDEGSYLATGGLQTLGILDNISFKIIGIICVFYTTGYSQNYGRSPS
jgi:hypothetical protein